MREPEEPDTATFKRQIKYALIGVSIVEFVVLAFSFWHMVRR